MRIVQLTPPGSACSIVIGTGMGEISAMQPGSIKGLHLVVADIHKAREALAGRGVTVSEVNDMGGVKYVYFSDPDGNSWALQEIPALFADDNETGKWKFFPLPQGRHCMLRRQTVRRALLVGVRDSEC